jgi:hypothetical protein
MLVIRREQIEVLQRSLVNAVRDRLFDQLKSLSNPQSGTDADLLALVDLGIARCRRFRLVREGDIARYLAIESSARESGLLTHQSGFTPEWPVEALQILTIYGGDPHHKLDRLTEWVNLQPQQAQTTGVPAIYGE